MIFRFVLLTPALALDLQVIIMTEGNLFIVAVVLVSFSERILKHISICSYFMQLRGNAMAANLADLKFRLTKLLSFRRIKWITIPLNVRKMRLLNVRKMRLLNVRKNTLNARKIRPLNVRKMRLLNVRKNTLNIRKMRLNVRKMLLNVHKMRSLNVRKMQLLNVRKNTPVKYLLNATVKSS